MKKAGIFFLLLSIISYSSKKRELSVFDLKEKEARFEKAQLEAIKNNTQTGEIQKKENTETETLFEDENPLKKERINENKKKKLINHIRKQNPKLNEKQAEYILNNVWKYSKQYDFNPYVVLAVMNTESHFNHNTVSSAGAKGLMQLMPFNFKEFNVNNSIEGNILGGVMHLKRDYEKTGSVSKMLVCYNAGCGRLTNNAWKRIKETREYIPKVIQKYNKIINL